MALFLVIPIIASLVLAFYDWPGIPGAPFDFTAFKNFRIVLSYPQFWESVRHILWWIIPHPAHADSDWLSPCEPFPAPGFAATPLSNPLCFFHKSSR